MGRWLQTIHLSKHKPLHGASHRRNHSQSAIVPYRSKLYKSHGYVYQIPYIKRKIRYVEERGALCSRNVSNDIKFCADGEMGNPTVPSIVPKHSYFVA